MFAIIIMYITQKLVKSGLDTLKNQKKLEEHFAYTLNKGINWFLILVASSVILAQFGISLGVVSGILTVIGSTILGFAAVNTIGNAIAGLIVMTSRPFSVGDRIMYSGVFSDIVTIELIYTKMRTVDNVLVSVPNQELLKSEIDNYGKNRVIRRQCVVTPGFNNDSDFVEKVLLDAAKKVSRVLVKPVPYVYIRKFGDFAVEYVLHVFMDDVQRIPEIDSALHKAVLAACKENNINISTPHLIQKVQ